MDNHRSESAKEPSSDDRAAYSIDEFAKIHGVCRDVIYENIAIGRIRAVKLGRRTLIPASERQRFLSELPPLRLPYP